MLLTKYLYSRDKKLKIRLLKIEVDKVNDSHYRILRYTGLLDGQLILQPEITITKGKVKRTVLEQTILELNSIIKKQQDKGYETWESIMKDDTPDDHDSPMDYDLVDSLLSKQKTDANGLRKPMLAKDPKAGTKPKEHEFFDNKDWFISAKLDGLRCKGVLNDDGSKIDFYSRTGKLLKGSVNNFEKDPILLEFMRRNPGYEIDGEIYKHNVPLNKISGDVRKEVYDPARHDYLEYHIFDLPIDNVSATTRFSLLEELKEELGEHDYLKVVDHLPVYSYDDIMTIHDKFLENGYEGAMVQLQDSNYEFGIRSSNMWKIKLFQDKEFQIVGYKLGLRGAEDMCFIMQLEDGRQFEAKPQGNKELKDSYIDNFSNLMHKMGTVKFFNYTEYGIPNLPSFKCVREE
jgi:ATP-dependent DNA ligase